MDAATIRGRGGVAGLRSLLGATAAPILICPDASAPLRISHAVALFDSAPASLRALRAAAPLLSLCSKVTVVSAGEGALDFARALTARGVPEVRIEFLKPAISHAAARALVETPADVIVVGAWPELLGGWPKRSVTDLLLSETLTPLLLAA